MGKLNELIEKHGGVDKFINDMREMDTVIINYLEEMKISDNRSTADIFYYVIRTEKTIYLDCECYDGKEGEERFIYQDEIYTKEELRTAYYEKKLGKRDFEVFLCVAPERVFAHKVWKHENMFLTEKEAKEHLRINHYHYSENAHTYVEHAWRSPEMLKFFKNLFKYFNVEKTWG